MKVYVVDLTSEEREELLGLLKGGQEARVRKTNRTRILLLADEGRTDEDIAEALLTSVSTVERTRRRFVEGGPGGHWRRPRPPAASESSTAARKHTSWPSRVATRPRGASGGRCNSWPRGWWRSAWSTV
jgi:hypothetical protein